MVAIATFSTAALRPLGTRSAIWRIIVKRATLKRNLYNESATLPPKWTEVDLRSFHNIGRLLGWRRGVVVSGVRQ